LLKQSIAVKGRQVKKSLCACCPSVIKICA